MGVSRYFNATTGQDIRVSPTNPFPVYAPNGVEATLGAGTSLIGKVQIANSGGTVVDPQAAGVLAATASTSVTTSKDEIKVTDVTLSLDTSAYASGDVVADTQQIDGAFKIADAAGVLVSLMLIDQDDQKAALDVYFLSANVAMGTENSAPSITDANAVSILGKVAIAVADYSDLGGVSVVSKNNIGMVVKPVTATDDLYVAVVNGAGTPTYTASGIKLRVGIAG